VNSSEKFKSDQYEEKRINDSCLNLTISLLTNLNFKVSGLVPKVINHEFVNKWRKKKSQDQDYSQEGVESQDF